MREQDEEMPKMKKWAKLTDTKSKFLSPLSSIIQVKKKTRELNKTSASDMLVTWPPLPPLIFPFLSPPSFGPQTP